MIEEFLGIIVLFVLIHNALHAAVLLLQFFLVCCNFDVVLCHCLFIMSSYFTDVFTLLANLVILKNGLLYVFLFIASNVVTSPR